jgi:hypothetical protein
MPYMPLRRRVGAHEEVSTDSVILLHLFVVPMFTSSIYSTDDQPLLLQTLPERKQSIKNLRTGKS